MQFTGALVCDLLIGLFDGRIHASAQFRRSRDAAGHHHLSPFISGPSMVKKTVIAVRRSRRCRLISVLSVLSVVKKAVAVRRSRRCRLIPVSSVSSVVKKCRCRYR